MELLLLRPNSLAGGGPAEPGKRGFGALVWRARSQEPESRSQEGRGSGYRPRSRRRPRRRYLDWRIDFWAIDIMMPGCGPP
jgi:hypothetical protein